MPAPPTATTVDKHARGPRRSPARGETRIRRLGSALREVVETQTHSSLDRGLEFIRREPVKALALAGAAGALASLLLRRAK